MKSLWFLIALTIGACEDRGVSGVGQPRGGCEGCGRAEYVVSGLRLPSQSQASRVGCDLDGDGQIDNALGRVVGGLPSVNALFDFQRAADDAFQTGALVLLLDVGYAPDLQ